MSRDADAGPASSFAPLRQPTFAVPWVATVREWFVVESWAEHLRQHQRVSRAEANLQAEAQRFHVGPHAPQVHHLLALDLRDERPSSKETS